MFHNQPLSRRMLSFRFANYKINKYSSKIYSNNELKHNYSTTAFSGYGGGGGEGGDGGNNFIIASIFVSMYFILYYKK